MAIEVELPDGSIAEFPDDTSPDVIKAALQKKFGGGQPKDYDLADVPAAAADNFVGSAKQAASDLVQPILHPIDTANALGDIAGGVAAKVGIGDHDQAAADQLGEFFAKRYGGWDAVKRTMAEDPVGFLSDVGTVLSGGSLAGARAGGLAGTAARVAGRVGNVVDPIALAGSGAAMATRGVGRAAAEALGVTTGVGGAPIREMAAAGRAGGAVQDAAIGAMRGNTPLDDITDDARGALSEMRHDRNSQYQADIANVRADNQTLSFRRPFQEIGRATNELTYRGAVKDTAAMNAVNEARDLIREFRNDRNLHTPAGFDTLKQRLDEIRAKQPDGSRAQTLVGKISDSVRDTARDASTDYARALSSYSADTQQIKSLEKEFSLKPGSHDNTALRKLLSSLRQNVNTNFGRREQMLDQLNQRRPTLKPAVAGATMAPVAPVGLQRVLAGASLIGANALSPWMLAALPAQSPRLAGEMALKAGQAARHLTPEMRKLISSASYQAGRAKREAEKKKKGGE
jgi:hypothetical protein